MRIDGQINFGGSRAKIRAYVGRSRTMLAKAIAALLCLRGTISAGTAKRSGCKAKMGTYMRVETCQCHNNVRRRNQYGFT